MWSSVILSCFGTCFRMLFPVVRLFSSRTIIGCFDCIALIQNCNSPEIYFCMQYCAGIYFNFFPDGQPVAQVSFIKQFIFSPLILKCRFYHLLNSHLYLGLFLDYVEFHCSIFISVSNCFNYYSFIIFYIWQYSIYDWQDKFLFIVVTIIFSFDHSLTLTFSDKVENQLTKFH